MIVCEPDKGERTPLADPSTLLRTCFFNSSQSSPMPMAKGVFFVLGEEVLRVGVECRLLAKNDITVAE